MFDQEPHQLQPSFVDKLDCMHLGLSTFEDLGAVILLWTVLPLFAMSR